MDALLVVAAAHGHRSWIICSGVTCGRALRTITIQFVTPGKRHDPFTDDGLTGGQSQGPLFFTLQPTTPLIWTRAVERISTRHRIIFMGVSMGSPPASIKQDQLFRLRPLGVLVVGTRRVHVGGHQPGNLALKRQLILHRPTGYYSYNNPTGKTENIIGFLSRWHRHPTRPEASRVRTGITGSTQRPSLLESLPRNNRLFYRLPALAFL